MDDGTPRICEVRREAMSTPKSVSLFGVTEESTPKESETGASRQPKNVERARKRMLESSLFGESNKVVPLVPSGRC